VPPQDLSSLLLCPMTEPFTRLSVKALEHAGTAAHNPSLALELVGKLNEDVFDLGIQVESVHAKLASQAGFLVTAEGCE
jgi:hypothetical protein